MATQQSQQPLKAVRLSSKQRTYLTVLMSVTTVGVALSAFDSIARNVALPLILHDLHITVAFGGLVFSASFLVTFLANLVLGQMMDRWGRKNTFLASLVFTALFSGLTAFVTQAWQFAVVGALAGVCLAVFPSAQVLVGEESPSHLRGLLMGIITGSFSFGAIVVGLLGSVVLPTGNWRLLFLIAFAPVIVAIVAVLTLQEPVRSQESQRIKKGGDPDAAAVTHRIDVEKARQSEWRQVFASDLRRQSLVLLIAGFLLNFGTGLVLTLGVTFFISYDHLGIGQASLAITIESLMAFLGGIALGRIGDYLPARNVLIVVSLVGAGVLMLLAIPAGVGLVFAVMAVFGFCGQGVLACWLRYVTESFPTRARGTGVMLVEGTFFLGLAFAPTLFGSLMGAGLFAATAIVAGVIMGVGALVLLAGTTFPPRKELEEIHI